MLKEVRSKFRIITADDKEFQTLWDKGLEEFSDTSPFYTSSIRTYDHLYLGSSFLRDDSCVLIDGQGKVVAYVKGINLSSQKIFRKLGFKRNGVKDGLICFAFQKNQLLLL